MTWAVLDADGYIAATYQREASARLNCGERPVVEIPVTMGEATARWRWDGEAWAHDPARNITPPLTGYAANRRQAYGQALDTDLQFEALAEAVNALVLIHRSGLPAPADAFAKLDAINVSIAAIKLAHPKD